MALLLLRTLVLAFIYLVEAALVLVFIRVYELPLHILIPDVVVAGLRFLILVDWSTVLLLLSRDPLAWWRWLGGPHYQRC